MRADLSEGQQSVQSAHAAINFCFEYHGRASPWWKDSNYLVQLTCKNLREMEKIIEKCDNLQIPITIFREPDIDNQITAISMLSSIETKRVTSNLPLLFKIKKDEKRNKCSLEINGYQV